MSEDPAHDVLAAEEFGVPAPDPELHREEPAHDVLAAEEFGVPAPDPRLRRSRRAAGSRALVILGALVLGVAFLRRRGRKPGR